ncbi:MULTISPECIES: hypothetical protein [Nocardiopsis]|uniref:hypothetical protein n=1 Tax=Nocardiopsis TaxID=2013 RepID=UPI00117D35FF|nr:MULTISPECIES: hypothetical protein [Nocardiopsis]
MPFSDWREANRILSKKILPVSDEQRKLANFANLDLSQVKFHIVAAAMLEDHLHPMIWGENGFQAATSRQHEFLADLGSCAAGDASLSTRQASAWIQLQLALLNIKSLESMKLFTGDVVTEKDFESADDLKSQLLQYKYTVSRIGRDGRVYFKDGGGKSAWAYKLKKHSGG